MMHIIFYDTQLNYYWRLCINIILHAISKNDLGISWSVKYLGKKFHALNMLDHLSRLKTLKA